MNTLTKQLIDKLCVQILEFTIIHIDVDYAMSNATAPPNGMEEALM